MHVPCTVSTAEATSAPASFMAKQKYSAASSGSGWRSVRVLLSVLWSSVISVIVVLMSFVYSGVRLGPFIHDMRGNGTPVAIQVNIAGLGDTTVAFVGSLVMVGGAGVGRKVEKISVHVH